METIKINGTLFVFPKIWYVSENGDDIEGNGGQGNPFRTVLKAVNVASDGDCIKLGNGTFVFPGVNEGVEYDKELTFVGEQLSTTLTHYASSTLYTSFRVGKQRFINLKFDLDADSSTYPHFGVRTANIICIGVVFNLINGCVFVKTVQYRQVVCLINSVRVGFEGYMFQGTVSGNYNLEGYLYNCYGLFNKTGAYSTVINVDGSSLNEVAILDSEFRNTIEWTNGVGQDPDGAQSQLGVYHGALAWGEWNNGSVKLSNLTFRGGFLPNYSSAVFRPGFRGIDVPEVDSEYSRPSSWLITTKIRTEGKYYWEITIDPDKIASGLAFGVTASDLTITSTFSHVSAYWHYDGTFSYGSGTSGFSSGDVLGFAFDFTLGEGKVYKNGEQVGTLALPGVFSPFFYVSHLYYDIGWNVNFGAEPFIYDPPESYLPYDSASIVTGSITFHGNSAATFGTPIKTAVGSITFRGHSSMVLSAIKTAVGSITFRGTSTMELIGLVLRELEGVYQISSSEIISRNQPILSEDLANYIEVWINPMVPAATAEEIYRSKEAEAIPPGETKVFSVEFNEEPVIEATATMEEAGPNLSIITSDTKYYGSTAEIAVYNSGATAETCVIVVNGKPLEVQGRRKIVVKDEESILDHGLVKYKFDSPLVQDEASARDIGQKILRLFSVARANIEITWRGDPAQELADICQIPEFEKLGVTKKENFYITRQHFVVEGGGLDVSMAGRKVPKVEE